jgi:hypothetical protein
MNMQFLNSQSNTPYGKSSVASQSNVTMLTRRRTFNFPIQTSNILQNTESNKIEEPPKPTMLWGPPIWFLFHTIAEKVKDDDFSNIKNELLNNIYSIATHLPCPVCSTHATEYLNKINFNSIKTKNDLKILLFQFHNEVNKRKGYPIFTIDELNEKYSTANTVNIIHNFMIHFKDKNRSPKLIADDLQRARIATYLIDWFQKNIIYFDL